VLTVNFYKEDGYWFAEKADWHIKGFGKTPQEALTGLLKLIEEITAFEKRTQFRAFVNV